MHWFDAIKRVHALVLCARSCTTHYYSCLASYHCEVPCLHLPQISRTINNDHPTDQRPLVMSLLLVSRHFGDVGRTLHTGVELT